MSLTTQIRGAQIGIQDDEKLYFDTAKEISLRYSTDHDSFVFHDSSYGIVQINAEGGIGFNANTGADANGNWEPWFELHSGGSVALVNTTQGQAGHKRFTIKMTDGVGISTSVASNKRAILKSDNITGDKILQFPDVAGTFLVTGNPVIGGSELTDDAIAEVKLDIHNAPAIGKFLSFTANGMEWVDSTAPTEDYIQEAEIVTENLSVDVEVTGYDGEHTLANIPVVSSILIFLNGLLQEDGTGKDYEIGGTGNKTITFSTIPVSGDIIIAHYIKT